MDLSAIEDVLSGKSRWAAAQGDCVEVMAAMPEGAVNLVFGSPPYVAARLYLEGGVDLGIARGAEEWSAWMQQVYAACLRVCPGLTAMVIEGSTDDFRYDCAPALLMADLCRAGVTLRKPPIYQRFGVPGSGGDDWLKNCWEWIICATRGGRLPWADNTACAKPPKFKPGGACTHRAANGQRKNAFGVRTDRPVGTRTTGDKGKSEREGYRAKTCSVRRPNGAREHQGYDPPALANPGNVLHPTYTAEEVDALLADPVQGNIVDCGAAGGGRLGNNLAHDNEAPFPEALAEFFVLSFCPPNGIVLDPFVGSGTTLAAAVKHGRRAIGIDLRPSQVKLTTRRMSGVTPSLFSE